MSLLQTTLSSSNAKLRSYSVDPQLGKVVELVREWEHVDSRYAKSLTDSMSTTGPVINPVASASVYSGTWYRANDVMAEQMPMQDHIRIVETLVSDEAKGITYDWRVDIDQGRTVGEYYDQTKTQLDSIASSYSSHTQGHVYLLNVSRNKKGLWDVTATDNLSYAHNTTEYVSRTTAGEIIEVSETTNSRVQGAAGESTAGVVQDIGNKKNRDGTWDITDKSTTSEAVVGSWQDGSYLHARSHTSIIANGDDDIAPAPSQGIQPSVGVTPRLDGLFNVSVASATAEERWSAPYSYVDKNYTRSSTLFDGVKSVPSTSGYGGPSPSRNEDGTFSGRLDSVQYVGDFWSTLSDTNSRTFWDRARYADATGVSENRKAAIVYDEITDYHADYTDAVNATDGSDHFANVKPRVDIHGNYCVSHKFVITSWGEWVVW